MKINDCRNPNADFPAIEGEIMKMEFWGNSYHDLRLFLKTGYIVDFSYDDTECLMKLVTDKLQKEVLTRMTKGSKKNG